ncbi:MAG TPA: TIGR00282 family metallophosphoesterase [Syntrophorhabdaceae bacterium]|nr:TIGR00282 family metallophosphoesterase [Syntrophorhabdaceae bacterium]
MQNDRFTVLFLGDVIGKPGRKAVGRYLEETRADFVVINGENLAGGIGITARTAVEMLSLGVDAITTGNHVWKKKEVVPFLMEEKRVVRPLNYPRGTPGFGYTVVKKNDLSLCVANIEGRIFMNSLDCPFRAMEEFLEMERPDAPIIVDFHAEATSEKIAMGWYLDGKVTALMGTHTHVQTADDRVLPRGTGYITDAGMTGPADSVIGMDKRGVLERFYTQMPQKFEVGKDDIEVQGVLLTIDRNGHRCLDIKRVKEKVA